MTRTAGRPTNWAGNVTFSADRVHRPESVAQLQELVSRSSRVRALGTGHSFNRIADTDGTLVSVAGLPPVLDVDAEAGTVVVGGGMTYGEVATRLHERGLALHALGSLPQISVAGACSTGTHGSGDAAGSLASSVRGVELVGPGGELVHLRADADVAVFGGAVIALGALGVLTRLTLQIEPTYLVRQDVYDDLPLAALDEDFDGVLGSATSVSCFVHWRGDVVDQVWRKQRVEAGDDTPAPVTWRGARLAREQRHPVRGRSGEHATAQLGVPGPWHERLPTFRPDVTPSSGSELQSEYFVPREHATAALRELDTLRDRFADVLQVAEIRSVAAEEAWLSPAHQRHCAAFHFTWVDDPAAVFPVVAAIEERLLPLAAVPHWGKVFGAGRDTLRPRFARWDDAQQLFDARDPGGVFRNPFVATFFPLGG